MLYCLAYKLQTSRTFNFFSNIWERKNREKINRMFSNRENIDNLTFAIPFRTNAHKPRNAGISHCYFFKTSSRKEKSAKGRIPALDFSKSLIIEDEDIGRPTKIDNN